MATEKKRLVIDFETRSACDLKKTGAYRYSHHFSTQPTCLSFKASNESFAGQLKFHEINRNWEDLPKSFRRSWLSWFQDSFLFVGHNVGFEIAVYKNILVKRYGWPDIPFNRFRCTAAKAAACALPRNLEGAGAAMNLRVQKDKRGRIALMQTCRPTRQWNTWVKKGKIGPEPPMFLEPDAAPDVWKVLYDYNVIDTLAEEELDNSLPDLNPIEQRIWFLNQQLNWRGLRVDIPTIEKIVQIMESESKIKLKELDSLTMGLVSKPGARQAIFDFLEMEGVKLPDIRAKTVDDALKDGKISADAKKLLELRKALSKTSTKKYQSFLDRACEGGRIRDILLYHGASTGRDSGTGVQLHNLPKNLISQKEIDYVIEQFQSPPDETLVPYLKALYGNDLAPVFVSLLRGMLIPSEGKELFVADFSKIEVAVCWWLADNKPGLRVLNSGGDPYVYQAMANTGKKAEDITYDDRQLAKAQVLGSQFGMGFSKFQQTAWDLYRLKLTEEQSRFAIQSYRETNAAVPQLWKNYELAATEAIEVRKVHKINKCQFFVAKDFLWITLPSGRRLAYRHPTIGMRETDFGPRKTIEFWAVNSKTKKWSQERTWGGTLTENIVQAVARDLMMQAIVRLEDKGYQALLSVHDEAICERELGKGDLEEFIGILCERPNWADKELPLDAKGWCGPRYRK